MSKLYYAIPKRRYDPNQFLKNVTKWHGLEYEERADNILYLWLEDESTRGVDVTNEGEKIEIRTTILSNHHDYQLVNWIAEALFEEFGCTFIDEDDQSLNPPEIIDLANTSTLIKSDYNAIKALALNDHELSIFGPHREVYIGKEFITRIESFGADAAEQLELAIRHIQYDIPKLSGNYMQIETREGNKTINTLWLDERQIITKYDYLAININDERLLLITNNDLKAILPKQWLLLDEYTIDAAALNNEEINALIEKAMIVDRFID